DPVALRIRPEDGHRAGAGRRRHGPAPAHAQDLRRAGLDPDAGRGGEPQRVGGQRHLPVRGGAPAGRAVIHDLLVVGPSFAGLAGARAAALAGLRVLVVDKKPGSGARLHTTGMTVKDAVDEIAWLRDVPRELVRRIEGVRLYAPNLTHVDLRAPGYYFWAT